MSNDYTYVQLKRRRAGFIFVGITDWCSTGMLIARMPWNQRGSAACCTK